MATIVNDRDVLLQAAGVRLETVILGSSTTVDFANVVGGTKPSNNADVTATIINGTLVVTGGGITLSAGGAIKGGQTTFNTGIGFFLGYVSAAYKFSIGNPAGHYLTFDGSVMTLNAPLDFAAVTGLTKPSANADVSLSALNGGLILTGGGLTLSAGGSIKGGQSAYDTGVGFFIGYAGGAYKLSLGNSAGAKITFDGTTLGLGGGVNIDSSGQARFNGAYTTGGRAFAIVGNDAAGTASGAYGKGNGLSTSFGLYGEDSNLGVGVYGYSAHNVGGLFQTFDAAAIALVGDNTAGGVALWLPHGTMKWNGYTWAAPTGTGTGFKRDDGVWANLAKAVMYVSTGAAPGAGPIGSITIQLLDGTGTVKLATYA